MEMKGGISLDATLILVGFSTLAEYEIAISLDNVTIEVVFPFERNHRASVIARKKTE